MKKLTSFLALISLFAIFHKTASAQDSQSTGLDRKNFDFKTSPCQDFFQYTNGTWLKKNPVPAAYSSWSSFHEMDERNQTVLKQIAETSTQNQNSKAGSDEQLIGDFYAAAMDTDKIETVGLDPLKPFLNQIAEMQSPADIQNVVSLMHGQGLDVLFTLFPDADLINSQKIIGYAFQAGLGLPDRDYYIKTDLDSQRIRSEYQKHLAQIFTLLGYDAGESNAKADQVLKIETVLAKSSLTQLEKRNPQNLYHLVAVHEAEQITPHFVWSKYLTAMNLNPGDKFSMAPVSFFKTMDELITSEPLEAWQAYLQWHLLKETSPFLNAAFEEADFHFYGQILKGNKTMLPRWKRTLNAIDDNLGEVMGKLYVKSEFPPEAKKAALDLIHQLLSAYKQRIENLDWMEDKTKKEALNKLKTVLPKIGYPAKWRSYKALAINRNSYVENVLNAKAFESRYQLKKIGKSPDKNEWGMNPHEINAYYQPSRNEIVFPAGILQPPFFDFKADPAVNYGGIGAIIGHEMTHGFDDEGSQFDAKGNFKNWWTEKDKKEFTAKSQRLVDQYSKYQPLKGYFVNGKLTLGENIADLGGLTLAYAAFQNTKPKKEKIDGFTPEQRFFMAWAQGWRANMRPESQKMRLNLDPHSPGKFRVNGVVTNLPEFQSAFSCKDSDAMVTPEKKRAKIW